MKTFLTTLLLFLNFSLWSQSRYDEFIEYSWRDHGLAEWQRKIAVKPEKNILDYYLLLPKSLFEIENILDDDSRDSRMRDVNEPGRQGRVNVESGFLLTTTLTMALFKDRVNKKDIIAVLFGCGAPPYQVCDYGFFEFDQASAEWKINRNVFPWDAFYEKFDQLIAQKKLKDNSGEVLIPNIILPEHDTTIKAMDGWQPEVTLFEIVWNGEFFKIK